MPHGYQVRRADNFSPGPLGPLPPLVAHMKLVPLYLICLDVLYEPTLVRKLAIAYHMEMH